MSRFLNKIVAVSLCVIIMSYMIVSASAKELEFWYSDSVRVGQWDSGQVVYCSKLNSDDDFPFYTAMASGINKWKSALGLSLTYSTTDTSAAIQYYGGTKAQLDALGIFDSVPASVLGCTYTSYQSRENHTYYGAEKYAVTIIKVVGYVVDRADMNTNNTIKTATHELGHGMGWLGHPATYQPTWVMQQGLLENTSLSSDEVWHLFQLYI